MIEGRCAGEDDAEGGQVVLVDDWILGEEDDAGRREIGAHDAVGLHHFEERLEVEAGAGDERGAAMESEVEHYVHAVDVEERQDGDPAFGVGDLHHLGELHDVGDQVAMGELDAFGQAGGPA